MFGSKKKSDVHSKPAAAVKTADKMTAKIDELQKTIAAEQATSHTPPKRSAESAAMPNSIGEGTVVEGNVVAESDLHVLGVIRGDVVTTQRLVVALGACVEGNITAEHAEIAGTVRGNVHAHDLVVIKASSMIVGDVFTKNLNVESGSSFNGRLQVGVSTAPAMAEPPAGDAVPAAVAEPGESVFG